MRNREYVPDDDKRNRIIAQLQLLHSKQRALMLELGAVKREIKTIGDHQQFNTMHLNRQQDIIQKIEMRTAEIDQEISTIPTQPPPINSSMNNAELLSATIKAMEGFLRLPRLQELEEEKQLLQRQCAEPRRKMNAFKRNLEILQEKNDRLCLAKQNLLLSLTKLKLNYTLLSQKLSDQTNTM